jgi:hypothetical protein
VVIKNEYIRSVGSYTSKRYSESKGIPIQNMQSVEIIQYKIMVQ